MRVIFGDEDGGLVKLIELLNVLVDRSWLVYDFSGVLADVGHGGLPWVIDDAVR